MFPVGLLEDSPPGLDHVKVGISFLHTYPRPGQGQYS